MAAFDAMFLVLLFEEKASTYIDPATGYPVTHAKERIEHLIASIEQSGEKVIIPMPALSEFLVGAKEQGQNYLPYLQQQRVFSIAPFDLRAAIELATTIGLDRDAGDKQGGVAGPWQKVKLDRQNVAIAKVAGATTFYTNDDGITSFANKAGLKVIPLHELELPPESAQGELALESPE